MQTEHLHFTTSHIDKHTWGYCSSPISPGHISQSQQLVFPNRTELIRPFTMLLSYCQYLHVQQIGFYLRLQIWQPDIICF